MSLCYLAGPVDAVSESERLDWRRAVAAALNPHGIATFSPPHAFQADPSVLDQAACEAIASTNDYALKKSNAIIANLGGRSYGTSLECELARRHRIPIYAFGVSKYSIYRWRLTSWTELEAPDKKLLDHVVEAISFQVEEAKAE